MRRWFDDGDTNENGTIEVRARASARRGRRRAQPTLPAPNHRLGLCDLFALVLRRPRVRNASACSLFAV